IFFCEFFAFFLGAGVAGENLELARTLDGVGESIRPPSHPDAGHAQRTGTHELSPSRRAEIAFCGLVADEATRLLLPTHPDRFDGRLGDAQISLPVAAADPDAADAFAVNQHRHAAL